MRRFFSISFIALALVISTAGAAPAAHAQGLTCTDSQTYDFKTGTCVEVTAAPAPAPTSCGPNYSTTGDPSSGFNLDGTPCIVDYSSGAPADFATGQAVIDEAAKVPVPPTSSPNDGYNSIMQKILELFALLLGVAALTLDYAVYYTVVTMGAYVGNLSAIGVTWTILRDIGNIMLIFGFLAVGITTILNVDWYGGGKKMLPMMLIAAVFLNFSLFISKAVIDTGNLFATQFYTQINGAPPQKPSMTMSTTVQGGISGKIMNKLGLQTLYGNAKNKDLLKDNSPWLVGFMGVLLFIVTAFVLFSLAFVLIARFVYLIFLIILSPVGFAGLAVPQLAKQAGQWWSKLFEQTITAPVLLLMLYIALAVIVDPRFLTGFDLATITGGASTGFVGNADLVGFGSYILSFLVAMGLLIAVVIQSKNLSAFGAAGASKLAGKLTFGATAFGMRSTLGWGSQGLSRAIRTSRIGGTKFGRVAATTFDKGAKASFDVRGATALGGLKAAGIDAGEAQKGGYRARREGAIKGHQDYIKTVGEAIDERGALGKEEKVIAEAKEAREKAERAHDVVKSIYEPAVVQLKSQVEQQKVEVERLKAIDKSNREKNIGDPKVRKDLDDAEQKLTTSETNLTAASAKLAETNDQLTKAQTAETAANQAPDVRIAGDKKKAQLAYAKNIEGSLAGWAMFGPGGAVAARKIIKGKKNTIDLDEMKKYLEEKDKPKEEKGKPEAEKKPEEKKPEAPKP